jgi:hypothetical protein
VPRDKRTVKHSRDRLVWGAPRSGYLGSLKCMSQKMHKAAFTPDNAAMLLIDHQIGTTAWTHSHDINLVKQNALKLARIAKAAGLPTVLTASIEDRNLCPLGYASRHCRSDFEDHRRDHQRARHDKSFGCRRYRGGRIWPRRGPKGAPRRDHTIDSGREGSPNRTAVRRSVTRARRSRHAGRLSSTVKNLNGKTRCDKS